MSEDKGPDFGAGIAATLQYGAMLAGTFHGEPVVLLNDGGQYRALAAKCTHMGAPLNQGILVDGVVRCPWHHARFCAATGEATGAPAFPPLTRYATAVREGRVFVTAKMEGAGEGAALRDAGTPGRADAASRGGAGSPAHVVIIGGGAAGHACAEWLKRANFAGSVTVLSDDADAPYDRTVCSKQYLTGMKSREASALAEPPVYDGEAGSPTLRLGCRVRAIDTESKSVLLEGDERVSYDVLVLATGAEPKWPSTPGFDLPNVHVLRTLRDADALIRASVAAKRVVIVGAGFIGLEAAASLTQRKLEVHVVTPEPLPLSKLLGADVGKMIQQVHEEKGVHFHVGREVRRFDGRQLLLNDGSEIAADFVVLGVGVTPRIELAQAAGLDMAPAKQGGGVVVNGQLETSKPGIYAIGDIARYPDVHVGESIRVEHWVHAQRQGQHVARVILGDAAPFTDVPFFWSAHFDTGLRYLGHAASVVDMRTEGSIHGRKFTAFYRGPQRQKAFVTCNCDTDALLEEAAWDWEASPVD